MSGEGPNAHLLKSTLELRNAQETIRSHQQGYGRPIISAQMADRRVVFVGSRMYCSPHWKTFHDFLFDYLKMLFGMDWGRRELERSADHQHPILQWYHQMAKEYESCRGPAGTVKHLQMTGASAAYLHLAYNLYLLAHNANIQKILVARLKNRNTFHGAYYETFVAAAFIRAGFTLELENERDGSTTHCEFVACSPWTGKKYSVEAKARHVPGTLGTAHSWERMDGNAKVGHQLYRALQKHAVYERVIFIDVNVPDEVSGSEEVHWLSHVLSEIRTKESSLTIARRPAPPAYVFLTNFPYHYRLSTSDFRVAVCAEGFKIPDFKAGAEFPSLRAALDSRERHADMHRLMHAFRTQEVPATFDGEPPELVFGAHDISPLRIGSRYLIPDAAGEAVPGTLYDICVIENEELAYGVYKTDDGRHVMATSPLTKAELDAFHRYGYALFGLSDKGKQARDAIEMYDFLFACYSKTSKDKLLEFLQTHPRASELEDMDQLELAKIYCEMMATSMMAHACDPADKAA